MAVKSGFFNSVAGDRKYDASFFADYFASFIGNGVFPNPSNCLQVVEGENMQTIVKPGKGWINGYYIVNTDDFIIQHEGASGSLHRIDRIVVQKSTAGRENIIFVKKGTEASSPVPPAVVRNADYHELVLADVYIRAGATTITQANITDQRLNKSLCGIVHAVVDQVDSTTIFNQYQSWFNQYSQQESADWETWIANFQQLADTWIQSEQTDFGLWRMEQETLFSTWYNQQQSSFVTWFNDIKAQLATVDIGEHLVSETPHRFTDSTNGKLFKWGMGAENGVPFLLIEEVV